MPSAVEIKHLLRYSTGLSPFHFQTGHSARHSSNTCYFSHLQVSTAISSHQRVELTISLKCCPRSPSISARLHEVFEWQDFTRYVTYPNHSTGDPIGNTASATQRGVRKDLGVPACTEIHSKSPWRWYTWICSNTQCSRLTMGLP